MDTGIYVALSKEVGIFHDMEVTANNLANMNTTGFQAEGLLFENFMTSTTKQENHIDFTNDVATYRNTQQGTLQITSNPLDAAIEGSGYFVVQTPLGLRYTRNGNFKIGATGELVTSDGYRVLDDGNQAITFDDTDRTIDIRADGTINVDNNPRSTLKIVQFNNEQLLRRVGNNLYSSDVPSKPAENFQVVNGALERSNVSPFTALTHMIDVSRSITNTANLINTMYTLERKASDTLAKVYS
jgi:flagellar basal-body rod protein FlgF